MKHYLYTLLLAFMCIQTGTTAYAQPVKNTVYKVAIGDITYINKGEEKKTFGTVLGTLAGALVSGKKTKQQDQYIDAVRASIVKGFGNVRRFRTIEGSFLQDEIAPEEQAFYVDGSIANITTTSKTEPSKVKDKPAQQYYKAIIGTTLNLKDARTDEVINSCTFSITETDCGWVSTAEKAINETLIRLSARITNYYNALYPLRASVIERGEIKKNKQKEVYIDLGLAHGAYEGQHFDIYSLKTIAGKEARIEIGRIKISQIMGDELSLCKVTRGEDKVKTALDGGETLMVVSRE